MAESFIIDLLVGLFAEKTVESCGEAMIVAATEAAVVEGTAAGVSVGITAEAAAEGSVGTAIGGWCQEGSVIEGEMGADSIEDFTDQEQAENNGWLEYTDEDDEDSNERRNIMSKILFFLAIGALNQIIAAAKKNGSGNQAVSAEAKEIESIVKALQKGLNDVNHNAEIWNRKVKDAMKAGKLQQITQVGNFKVPLAKLFSTAMNKEVKDFFNSVMPALKALNTEATKKKPEMTNIKNAAIAAAMIFETNAKAFLVTVKTWDKEETLVKTEAGIDFKVQQLTDNINAICEYLGHVTKA